MQFHPIFPWISPWKVTLKVPVSPGTGAHRGQGLIVGADGRGSRDQQIAEFPEAPNAHVDQGLLAQDPKVTAEVVCGIGFLPIYYIYIDRYIIT